MNVNMNADGRKKYALSTYPDMWIEENIPEPGDVSDTRMEEVLEIIAVTRGFMLEKRRLRMDQVIEIQSIPTKRGNQNISTGVTIRRTEGKLQSLSRAHSLPSQVFSRCMKYNEVDLARTNVHPGKISAIVNTYVGLERKEGVAEPQNKRQKIKEFREEAQKTTGMAVNNPNGKMECEHPQKRSYCTLQ